jgi:endonuclease I
MKLLTLLFIWLSFTTLGQIPQGYYSSAEGLTGQELRAALQQIIDDHQEQSYASLWTHFISTDPDGNGMVWDMYSDIPGGNPAYTYTFIEDQCGNYGGEGDCYNREHSFPQSWFNDASPMVTDLFQIYPTDGYVNGKRSNYPYGEVGSASWVSTNGSKLGNCSYAGYSGVVFEPIDEYKGDFARTYFYMMTRYMGQVSSWNSDMLDGGDLALWAKEMLLHWDENDPVSQKEIDRNNAIYQIQDNRNPFIDHPEYADLIWVSSSGIWDFPDEDLNWSISRTEWENYKICDLSGRIISAGNVNESGPELQFNLKSGIYILILQGKSTFTSHKILIGAER